MNKYDCIIIGGGPAGLSGALALGRARKNVLVLDDSRPRNAVTHEMHGFLSRDRIKPSEFRRIAKEQISEYPTVQFAAETAVSVEGSDGEFMITTAQGQTYTSRKILFAIGKKDIPLPIAGLSDVYGKSAFVCPYCDGWELQDQELVIIAKGAGAFHLAKMIPGWSSRYAICTNGPDELTEEEREELRQHGVPVYDAPIRSIVSNDGKVERVELEDGTSVSCTGIFFAPQLTIGSELPASIGCEMKETGSVITDALGRTNVPGVYCAGDAGTEMYQAIAAASTGAMAAMSINGELLMESWNRSNY
ncbi:NAD(P)/FAD-dependent oxidoreductase [Paenibacillus sp. PR3]|uniref:NAD(P)/FAD-dependent oxidoreductase n=1 Tax=Paenibacillus terricola TaxID=2763503 RepID=A0ABR8MZP1_9BACL|nr:NAD(P)/FAD-dependent oxidoreductase [Paenibacillus terricola]MBD3920481.1 NAD(P)/FAD-dependent oxidoreductase [Paenibacillus terricola]